MTEVPRMTSPTAAIPRAPAYPVEISASGASSSKAVALAQPARLGRPVHAQGPEGEVLAVAVVAQIEDARKPRAGVLAFRPETLGVLLPEQVVHAAQYAVRVHLAGAEEREQRPCGL